MAEKIPRITPEHHDFMRRVGVLTPFNPILRDLQELVRGVSSGEMVVIPREEAEALRDWAMMAPHGIAKKMYAIIANWLREIPVVENGRSGSHLEILPPDTHR